MLYLKTYLKKKKVSTCDPKLTNTFFKIMFLSEEERFKPLMSPLNW